MTSKGIVCAVAMVGLLGLSVTAAQAGGGFGGNVPQSGFFVCHGINGGDQGLRVDIHSDELGVETLTNVRIGSGVLGCAYVTLTRADTGAAIEPAGGLFLKCYSIAVSRRPGAPPAGTPTAWNATDAVEPAGETVVASEIRYLCGTANFSQ